MEGPALTGGKANEGAAPLSPAVEQLIDQYHARFVADLDQRALVERKQIAAEAAVIWHKWGDALKFLITVEKAAVAAAGEYAEFMNGLPVGTDATKFQTLLELHGRLCRTAREVRVLLMHGYPTAAQVLLRAMYELVVVAKFIGQRGDEVALRFREHITIQVAKYANLEHTITADSEWLAAGIEPAARERHARERRELIERYGQEFDSDYGWAAESLRPRADRDDPERTYRPTLADIEKAVELGDLRPLYRMLSAVVHPNGLGNLINQVADTDGKQQMLGHQDWGLAQPARWAMQFLHRGSVVMLSERELHSNDERRAHVFAALVAMNQLVNQATEVFDRIDGDTVSED